MLKKYHFSKPFQHQKIILIGFENLNKILFKHDINILFENYKFPCTVKELDVYNLWKQK